MDVLTIEKVGKILGELGDQTIEGLMFVLGASLLSDLIGYGIGALALCLLYRIIAPFAGALSMELKAIEGMKRLRSVLNVGEPGTLTRNEINNISNKVIRMKLQIKTLEAGLESKEDE